jgi:hypothetical protein
MRVCHHCHRPARVIDPDVVELCVSAGVDLLRAGGSIDDAVEHAVSFVPVPSAAHRATLRVALERRAGGFHG